MNKQLNSNTQIQFQDGSRFWDDDFNKMMVAALVLVTIILAIKYKPWRFLLPVAQSVKSVADSSVSVGVKSASSAGLSVAQMVSML